MNNSFFILSKQEIRISRFHICTWDIENANSFIEIGIEFNLSDKDVKEVNWKLVAPFVQKTHKIRCLASSLISDTNNCKFIFNDNIKGSSEIENDKRNGIVLNFETRGELSIIPITNIKIDEDGEVISFGVKNPQLSNQPNYIRFLIQLSSETLSTEKKGITQTNLIYDIKLNEKRNLPDRVHNVIKDEYKLCDVNACFCFHVIPNSLNISFVSQSKLKNVRELEAYAFKNYLPEIGSIKEGKYVIIFNKDENADAYSFFTIFTKETLGTKQLLLAISANILCSLFFSVGTLRTSLKEGNNAWEEIPIEYWIAISILILLIIYLFVPFRRIKNII